MLFRKSLIFGVILSTLPCASVIAANFPSDKRSTLPCLMGQSGFSNILIEHNPWVKGKVYSMSDGVLWGLMMHLKVPPSAIDLETLKDWSFSASSNNWKDYIGELETRFNKLASLHASGEVGIYFNRYLSFYASSLQNLTCALVMGGYDLPLKFHMNIGRFPIPFGSAFSEYSLKAPLTTDLGAATTKPTISLNTECVWNNQHKTRFKFFGYDNKFSKEYGLVGSHGIYDYKTKGSFEKGFNIHHEWNNISSQINEMQFGMSWSNQLPTHRRKIEKTYLKETQDGTAVYLHLLAKDLRIKLEAVWGGTISKKLSSYMSERIPTEREKPEEPYAWYVELGHPLPLKSKPIGVFTYQEKVRNRDTEKYESEHHRVQRILIGVKFSLLDNVNSVIGFGAESRTVNAKAKPQPWRFSIAAQFNFVV